MAEYIHPATLKFYPARINVTFEQLAEHYPEERLLQTIGIEMPPNQSDLSDRDLFVTICNRAAELEPNFSGDERYLPVTLHGVVFSEDNQAFVVYEYSDKAESDRSTVRFKQPGLTTFVKTGGR